jgi:hypothetical protein
MGGGGGILSPITELLFGSAPSPEPIIYQAPEPIQPVKTETAPSPSQAQASAETAAENAVAKEAERRRKAKGVLSTIVTGMKGDTSIAPILKQTLGGV